METEIKKKEQTMMCAENLKINEMRDKKINSQTTRETSGITLIALVVTKTLQVKPGVSSWRYITIGNMYTVCKNYNSTLNSHMMKNDEWGAVAYLSKSKYGKNGKVDINDNSSYYTGGGNGNAYVNNIKQSTTGTIYGVYDMSGGAGECVASYINNENSNLTDNGQSLVNGDKKTKNVYIMTGR